MTHDAFSVSFMHRTQGNEERGGTRFGCGLEWTQQILGAHFLFFVGVAMLVNCTATTEGRFWSDIPCWWIKAAVCAFIHVPQ